LNVRLGGRLLTIRKQKFARCEWLLLSNSGWVYNANEAGLNWVLRSTVPYLAKMALLAAMW
jgi:hypothetical protein